MAYKKFKFWFDKELAVLLSDKISEVKPQFDSKNFINDVSKGTTPLELKDRVGLIADLLKKYINCDYPKAVSIFTQILGDENPNETGMFTEYYWLMPVAKYVEKYGVPHFDLSINIIKEITKRHTGEYAIRVFLEKYPQKTLNVLSKWALDENFHVRRLASEGVRSRLPWAKKLTLFIEKPKPVISILESLKTDNSKYVQKSVANNLNDLLKDNSAYTLSVIRIWCKAKPLNQNTRWIIKHALRNKIKSNDEDVLDILAAVS